MSKIYKAAGLFYFRYEPNEVDNLSGKVSTDELLLELKTSVDILPFRAFVRVKTLRVIYTRAQKMLQLLA